MKMDETRVRKNVGKDRDSLKISNESGLDNSVVYSRNI